MHMCDKMYRRKFKRYGKARRGSTNYVTATYQEIYDVNTVSNDVTVIGIHTPTGSKPRQMLSGYFTQYRKYSYLGCSVVGTFAAQLPLDILNVGVEAGQGADPRDVLNPILSRGCHGDNLNAALNSIYKGSFQNEGSSLGKDDHGGSVQPTGGLTWEQMYYRMLQDPSFKKYRMGSGFSLKNLRPMVYNVASDHQILPNEVNGNVGALKSSNSASASADVVFDASTQGLIADGDAVSAVHMFPQFMTNRLQRLGWLDTRQVVNSVYSGNVQPAFTVLPRIFMSALVLPKSYRASNCMRIVISHKFAFKEFNTSLTLEGASEYYDWLSSIVPGSKDDSEDSKVSNDTLEVLGGNAEIVSDGVF